MKCGYLPMVEEAHRKQPLERIFNSPKPHQAPPRRGLHQVSVSYLQLTCTSMSTTLAARFLPVRLSHYPKCAACSTSESFERIPRLQLVCFTHFWRPPGCPHNCCRLHKSAPGLEGVLGFTLYSLVAAGARRAVRRSSSRGSGPVAEFQITITSPPLLQAPPAASTPGGPPALAAPSAAPSRPASAEHVVRSQM